jgi:hypothetical protein
MTVIEDRCEIAGLLKTVDEQTRWKHTSDRKYKEDKC